ncbi:hypothetical protein [Pseudaeromonas paramecii]|uniref:Uncharacterized protein n=1 Tax=Pseudaeromonas paramecii TaxID=2138166 RepID=A0ABP8PY43_9GAMM
MDDVCKTEPIDLISSFLLSLETKDPELRQAILEIKAKTRIDEILGGRYSLLFLLDLYHSFENRSITLDAIMHEVKCLEGEINQSRTKPASQFSRPPLKGLWHKHFYDSNISGMVQNMMNALNTYSIPYFESKIEEAKTSGIEQYMTVEDIPHIVEDIVSRNLQKRSEEQRMTGEWIIYANHNGVNYYLCIAKHKEGDESIRKRLDAACLLEFPFLKDLLPAS